MRSASLSPPVSLQLPSFQSRTYSLTLSLLVVHQQLTTRSSSPCVVAPVSSLPPPPPSLRPTTLPKSPNHYPPPPTQSPSLPPTLLSLSGPTSSRMEDCSDSSRSFPLSPLDAFPLLSLRLTHSGFFFFFRSLDSFPHYLCEIIEWTGFALACSSPIIVASTLTAEGFFQPGLVSAGGWRLLTPAWVFVINEVRSPPFSNVLKASRGRERRELTRRLLICFVKTLWVPNRSQRWFLGLWLVIRGTRRSLGRGCPRGGRRSCRFCFDGDEMFTSSSLTGLSESERDGREKREESLTVAS